MLERWPTLPFGLVAELSSSFKSIGNPSLSYFPPMESSSSLSSGARSIHGLFTLVTSSPSLIRTSSSCSNSATVGLSVIAYAQTGNDFQSWSVNPPEMIMNSNISSPSVPCL